MSGTAEPFQWELYLDRTRTRIADATPSFFLFCREKKRLLAIKGLVYPSPVTPKSFEVVVKYKTKL